MFRLQQILRIPILEKSRGGSRCLNLGDFMSGLKTVFMADMADITAQKGLVSRVVLANPF
jgi:hypothetical protein